MQTNQVVMSLLNFSGPPSVTESPIPYRVLPVGTSDLEIKYGGYSQISGLKGKIFSNEKKDHFLDYAKDCDEDIIQDRIKIIGIFTNFFLKY